MKNIFFLLILISTNSFATRFEIIDTCSKTPVFKTTIDKSYDTLGELSLDTFERNGLQNQSSKFGVAQLLNSPIGLDAMEILSDTKMRSHGWCYSVDGEIPEVLMNEVLLTGEEKVIKWFMGYSTYIGNPETGDSTWEGQCVPSNSLPISPFPELCN